MLQLREQVYTILHTDLRKGAHQMSCPTQKKTVINQVSGLVSQLKRPPVVSLSSWDSVMTRDEAIQSS